MASCRMAPLSPVPGFSATSPLATARPKASTIPTARAVRGWANRLAERIAAAQGELLYANLGVRGRSTRQIRETQLDPALAMRPDLVSLFSGTNDVVRRRFDPARVAGDVREMHRALIGQGATLITFTLPDLAPVMPAARWIAPRVELLNRILREVSAESGALLVTWPPIPSPPTPGSGAMTVFTPTPWVTNASRGLARRWAAGAMPPGPPPPQAPSPETGSSSLGPPPLHAWVWPPPWRSSSAAAAKRPQLERLKAEG